MKKWLMMALIIAFVAWQFINKPHPGAEIDADGLKQLLVSGDRPVLIDVREPDEFASGHIPGSILIPLGELDSSDLLEGIDPSQTIVVICHSGSRSSFAQQMLIDMGYRNVSNLTGGIQKWDGPIEVN